MRWLALLLVCACVPDFRLDERRFRCPEPPDDCGTGYVCHSGLCTPPDQIPDAAPDGDVEDAMVLPFIDAAVDAAPGSEDCRDGQDNDGDDAIDCMDSECGLLFCEDDTICTDEYCLPNGACGRANVGRDCGVGCLCSEGEPHETDCNDASDNDADGFRDCRDTDCGPCGLGACCDDGTCSLLCAL